jgi:hypothetical protein
MPHDFKPQSAKDEHNSRDFKSFERKEHCGSPRLYLIRTQSDNPPLGVEVISEFQEFQEFKTTQSIFKR